MYTYGEKGIRGEVADGFSSITKIALPWYKKAIEEGKSENDAGVIALLALIANVYDTNLYKRGDADGKQKRAQQIGDPHSPLPRLQFKEKGKHFCIFGMNVI